MTSFAKESAGPGELAARLALGYMAMRLGQGNMEEARREWLEAQALHQAMRAEERMKMLEATERMRYSRPPILISARIPPALEGSVGSVGAHGLDPDGVPLGLDQGMVRLASIAEQAGSEMAKEALAFPGTAASRFARAATQEGMQVAKSSIPKLKSPISNVLQAPATRRLQQAYSGTLPQAAQAAKAPSVPKPGFLASPATKRLTQSATQEGVMAPTQSIGQRIKGSLSANARFEQAAGKDLVRPGTTPTSPGTGVSTPAPAPAPATSPTPSTNPSTPGKLGLGTKLLAGGAVLGTGYLASKALGKGLDYMSQESHPANYNSGGYQVPYGVNQYGQPQMGTPFY